jgi:hypothetical protein
MSNAKLISVAVVMLGMSACAGVGGAGRGAAADVRGMAAVKVGSPRVIATGPVRLLHVDVHGERPVALFSAVRRDGTDADCTIGGGAGQVLLRQDRRNPVDVDVPDGQVVCLVPAAAGTRSPARGVEVSWHLRREGGMPTGTLAFERSERDER